MHKATKVAVAIGILFIGIGVCVAGLLWSPLYATGALLISASLAMIPNILSSQTPANTPTHVDRASNLSVEIIRELPPRQHIENQLNLFFMYRAQSQDALQIYERSQERHSSDMVSARADSEEGHTYRGPEIIQI